MYNYVFAYSVIDKSRKIFGLQKMLENIKNICYTNYITNIEKEGFCYEQR